MVVDEKDERRAMAKLADHITIPQGISKTTPERLDTQSDLSSNALAKGLLYHRTLADRFGMFKAKDGKPVAGVAMIGNFANRLSMLPWAAHRKSRIEAVVFGRGMQEEKTPMMMESLEAVDIKAPEGEQKKRKLI